MPEPCTVYSTRTAPFTIEEISEWATGASVSETAGPDGSDAVTVQWPDCTLTISKMPPEELADHLDGFRDYVWDCAQEMTQAMYAIIQRTYFFHHCFGMVSEPSVTHAADSFLRTMAAAGCGVMFRENSVFDPNFDHLISPGRISEGRCPHYWQDALDRRERTVALLCSRDLQTPDTLPPVPGAPEVLLRNPKEVGRRALALYAVAYRAVPRGIGRRAAWSLLAGNESALTPAERVFLRSLFPGKNNKVQFGWRFEALWVLLWALGLVGDLGFPSTVTEVSTIDSLINDAGQEGLLNASSLRSTSDILDHLDLVYRCHWVARNVRVQGKQATDSLDPGVVFERHHALNWLTCHEHADWDDVSTDT